MLYYIILLGFTFAVSCYFYWIGIALTVIGKISVWSITGSSCAGGSVWGIAGGTTCVTGKTFLVVSVEYITYFAGRAYT